MIKLTKIRCIASCEKKDAHFTGQNKKIAVYVGATAFSTDK